MEMTEVQTTVAVIAATIAMSGGRINADPPPHFIIAR